MIRTSTLVTFFLGTLLGALLLALLYKIFLAEKINVAELPDGGEYIGSMENGKLHGYGKISWPDGTVIKGDFVRGMLNGFAVITFNDGNEYKGQVTNGLMQGSGVFKTQSTLYRGRFRQDRFHGYGVFHLEDGASYTGNFENGLFHGFGSYIDESNNEYHGHFVEGAFTGQGSYQEMDGEKYVGHFQNWVYHGAGVLTKDKGDQYTGEFEQGSLTGVGEMLAKNGDVYQGDFKYTFYHGTGALQKASGDTYEGGFKYGEYHGVGKLSYQQPLDGLTHLSGIWDSDELIVPDSSTNYITNSVLVEKVLYNQNRLLTESADNVKSSNPDNIELYFLGIAAHGDQAVFKREVLYVKDYFDQTFQTKDRSMVLINDRNTVDSHPLATKTSVSSALGTLAKKMDNDNDILFIYLSSHGSKAHDLSVTQPGLELNDLDAEYFSQAITDLPIKWKVVVISACYSGGYITLLENENTLVITASAEDKTSFGCSDENEFTYFGEAYFKDALPHSNSFIEAFDKAKVIVGDRETEQGYTFSDPQMSYSKVIEARLKTWREGL